MKKILTLFILLTLFISNLSAQQEIPRTEYTVSLSDDAISLKPGETKTLTLTLLKSKRYLKSNASLAFSSAIPEGLTISYAPSEGVFESSVVTISAAPTLKEGQYQVVLKATINHKIKGSILKVAVGPNSVKETVTVN